MEIRISLLAPQNNSSPLIFHLHIVITIRLVEITQLEGMLIPMRVMVLRLAKVIPGNRQNQRLFLNRNSGYNSSTDHLTQLTTLQLSINLSQLLSNR